MKKIEQTSKTEPDFITAAVDFFRTYADKTHHGKEEDILFRDLAKKQLPQDLKIIMDELVAEHIYGRKTVGNLLAAKEIYVQGNNKSLEDIIVHMKELVEFYPAHIEKEDKHFFYPCQEYFSQPEQEAMLQEFWEFDRKLIHEKYLKLVEEMEKQ